MRKRILYRVFGVLLAALFLSHYAGATLFVHTHNTAEGRLVTHSHPYLPSSSHDHSAAGFAAIKALTSLHFYAVSTAIFVVLVSFGFVQRGERSVATCAARFDWSLLRGPPVVC